MNNLWPLMLSNLKNVGKVTAHQILNKADKNNISDLNSLYKIICENKKLASSIDFEDVLNALDKANQIILNSEKINVYYKSIIDTDFPLKLKIIPDPPLYLFYKGNYDAITDENSIAVIGTRTPTNHGIKVAQRFGAVFCNNGYTVVSGLAKGCDENGHIGCIKEHGKTVAVLPCGLDKVYPASNKKLADEILINNGCLISEYPIGYKPFKTSFIERDRLQSALSKAVVVVETDIVGGTMHTVGYAKKQGRKIVCYDHADKYLNESQTKGTQKLILDKIAIPINSPEDIAELLDDLRNFSYQTNNKMANKENYIEQIEFEI